MSEPRPMLPAASAERCRAFRSPVRRGLGAAVHGRAALGRLASDVGQGTVEYVGLLLLMATLLAAIVGAASQLGGKDQIGKKVVNQIGQSIDRAGQGAER